MQVQTHTMELAGTSYEIGQQLGRVAAAIPPLKEYLAGGFEGFDEAEVAAATGLFARWCPGLNEELQGFADALNISLQQVVYYGMTYLRPGCSQIALLPEKTVEGKPLLARNYEFNPKAEDFTLVRTSAEGKYTHLGSSVILFGREEGVNDQGLAVSMSSTGFPVGPLPYMRSPKLRGLQFWAVIRTVLENCKDVEDALAYLKGMPIAFNINLMLVDKGGHIALVETLDGTVAVKRIGPGSPEGALFATNHPVLPEIIPLEPQALRHSALRYDWIEAQLAGKETVSAQDLKEMLLAPFPEGLCCHYFEDFFGTTKSMVLDPTCGTIELCWGGEARNGWKRYSVHQPLEATTADVELSSQPFDAAMGEYLPLQVKQ